jgi:hypothetical protein
MHETFVEELNAQERVFQQLSGTHQERMTRAVELIDELLSTRASEASRDETRIGEAGT